MSYIRDDYHHTQKIDCPFCGDECKKVKYYDEIGLTETDIQCKCGYHYSDAYGRLNITYPPEDESEEENKT